MEGQPRGRNDYRRKILASPSAAVHSSPGQTSTCPTFMGKDSWDPSCFYPQISLLTITFVKNEVDVCVNVLCQWDMVDVCGTVSDSSSDILPLTLPYKLKLRYQTDGDETDHDEEDVDADERYLTAISSFSSIN